MEQLDQYRAEINALDDQIVDLLARRFQVCHKVAAFKKERAMAVRLANRIEAVKCRNAERGAKGGLDPEFVMALYGLIIEQACREEEALIAAVPAE